MWTIYSNIELISDQQATNTEEPEDEELSSKRKASLSSSEPNSEPASQLNSSELLNSGSSTNESNSNEDINESVLVTESDGGDKKEKEAKSEAASEKNAKFQQPQPAGHQPLEDLYKQMPALALYATVSKNLKQADHLNNHHELMTNGKNYAQWNGRGNRTNRSSLNGCKFSRKPSLSARTTPVNQSLNADACCDEANRRSFLLSLHSNLANPAYGSISSPNNYFRDFSDADSTVSCYEAIDLGSNSIDSGYKSSSCCQTPDCHNSTTGTTGLIERRNGSIRSASSSSFHQQHFDAACSSQAPVNLNDKLIKQFQEIIAANAPLNGPMPKNNLLMNKGSAQLINSNDLQLINGTMNSTLAASVTRTLAGSARSQMNNQMNSQTSGGAVNGSAALRNKNQQLIDSRSGDHPNAPLGRTFKSALALKSSNPKLNQIELDYGRVRREYKNHRHLSQSEQYLDNLNDDYLGESLYPYLFSSTKTRQLFKNRSNLNLEQYLVTKIQQQNELLKQEIEQKGQQYGNYGSVIGQQQVPSEYSEYSASEYQTAQYQTPEYQPEYQTPEYQPTKVVKRKLPQINQLYSNRSELIRNKLYASSQQMHSSDLRLDQYQTNKYEHQARFKSIYIMNNKLRRQPHLSASIEQVSNLGGLYDEPRCVLSNSVDGTEEDAINLINTEFQLKANLIKQKNLLKQVNETLTLQNKAFRETEDNAASTATDPPIDRQLIDRLYSKVQKHQQKSSSTQSIYYQDYLDGQPYSSKHIESAASLAALTTSSQLKEMQLREIQSAKLNDKKDLEREKEIANNRKNEALNSQKIDANSQKISPNRLEATANESSSTKNTVSTQQDKQYKTRSADDLYRSMSNLVNNKFNQPNDATSKRRAFRLMGSPLRTLSKAFSSEASDLFRMKELAKSKFVNLIDNFASTNSSSNKKNSQDKQEKAAVNKSPVRGLSKKFSNSKSSAPHPVDSARANESLAKGEGNLYIYSHQQVNEQIQRQPLPPIPVEHLYEELKTVVDFKKVDLKKVEQQRTASQKKVDRDEPKQEAKWPDQRAGQRRDKKLERQERIERTEKQERIARKSEAPEIRINYCKQRSTASSASREQENLTRQARSMEERPCREQEDKPRAYSKSLDEECEEEIIRKVNSDDIITKIDDIITNIEQQLNNKENLKLEWK